MSKKIFQKKIIIPILLLLIFGGYFGYRALNNKNKEPRYLLASVEKGTLIVSVSGSGQVSASDQIDIKPKVNGEVAAIYVKEGEEIKTGKLIMKLDDTDFQKAVRDAETSLETAKLELEKLLEPPDELTLLQAENSLAQAKESKQKAEDNLEKAYEDGFNTVANAFLDLPTIMTGLQDILFGYDFTPIQWNINYYTDTTKMYDEKVFQYEKDAYDRYQTARKDYDQNFTDYKSASRYSDKTVIENLISQTYETTKGIAEAAKSANNLIQFYKDKLTERDLKPNPLADTHLSSLNAYIGKTNSHLLTLLSIKRTIEDSKESILNAERSIEEKEKSLAKLKAGPDELDIRAKKIAVQQKEDNLLTAKENLAKCYIYTPFNGLISDIKVKKGDSVSSGTALATLITKQKIAEISLNEVDAAKVKTGQKATLTFDALPEVSITGKVIEVDTVGTVSQGVVSYGVKIALDTDDERIKPGMSVTADIITDAKTDVLVLPNSAVKSQGNSYYVELIEASEEVKKQLAVGGTSGIILPKDAQIKNQPVEIGILNDTLTEIVSGLKEGDIVVSSTITPTTQTTQTQRTQQFQIPGMGGGQMRIQR
jgi:HlyD family secretion protein